MIRYVPRPLPGKAGEKGLKMLDFDEVMDLFYSEELPDKETLSPMERLHGPVVEERSDAYYDVTVYADGYEYRYYVGD